MRQWVHVQAHTSNEIDELTQLVAESLAFAADRGT